jgi:exosortase
MSSTASEASKPNHLEWILAALCGAVIIAFFGIIPLFSAGSAASSGPALYFLANAWNDETGYTHGWFIIPAVIAIVWKNWPKINATEFKPSLLGIFIVLFAIALFIIAVRTKHWRIAIGSLPILIYGLLVFNAGWKRANLFLFPLGLFYFCVPVPGLVDATNTLQLVVTKAAAKLAMVCGIRLDVTGNKVFLLDKGEFDVDEGCSGIRSLLALLLIAFVYGYFTHKAGWKRSVIFLSAIPLAIIANILRIFSILFVADKISVSFAQTIYHDKVGFFSFAIALGLLMLLSRILEKGFRLGPKAVVVKKQRGEPVSTESNSTL